MGGWVGLAGAHAHLTALAAKATHALLAPLGTHPAVDVHKKLDGAFLLHAKLREEAGREGGGARDEALEGGRDELLVLHRRLELLHL